MTDNNTAEKPKDPLVGFRSVIVGKDKKGADRIQLFLGGDERFGNTPITTMIEFLQTQVDNPRGCKLDVHIGERTTNDGRRTFLAAYAFLKPTEERPGASPSKAGWVAKGAPPVDNTTDRAAKVYRQLKD